MTELREIEEPTYAEANARTLAASFAWMFLEMVRQGIDPDMADGWIRTYIENLTRQGRATGTDDA